MLPPLPSTYPSRPLISNPRHKGFYNREEKPRQMWSIFSVRPSPEKKNGGSEPFANVVYTVFCLFLLGKECPADRLLDTAKVAGMFVS